MTMLATAFRMLVGFFVDDGSLFIKIRQHNGKRLRKSRHSGTRAPAAFHHDWLYSASEIG
jgi:hypothetical protein